jgi:hypothetical protein
MYQTFCVAFDYLLSSGKIYVDSENKKIVWIWEPEIVKRVLIRREAGKFAKEVVKVYGGKILFRPRPLKDEHKRFFQK